MADALNSWNVANNINQNLFRMILFTIFHQVFFYGIHISSLNIMSIMGIETCIILLIKFYVETKIERITSLHNMAIDYLEDKGFKIPKEEIKQITTYQNWVDLMNKYQYPILPATHIQVAREFGMLSRYLYSDIRKQYIHAIRSFIINSGYYQLLLQEAKTKEAFTEYVKVNHMNKFIAPKKNIYHLSNEGMTFVSLDIIKGNYTTLFKFLPSLLLQEDTDFNPVFSQGWDKLVLEAITLNQLPVIPSLVESKMIRQIVLGYLTDNQKSRIHLPLNSMVRNVMYTLMQDLGNQLYNINTEENKRVETKLDIVGIMHDEIIIKMNLDFLDETLANIRAIVSKSPLGQLNSIRNEMFKLHVLKEKDKVIGYAKEFIYTPDHTTKDKWILKGVDGKDRIQAIEIMNDLRKKIE